MSIKLQGYLVFVILSQMLFFMNELSDVGMSASDVPNCQLLTTWGNFKNRERLMILFLLKQLPLIQPDIQNSVRLSHSGNGLA